jgi:CelD/BcsL family acetyltransferase involved in cellulose biosynthesis
MNLRIEEITSISEHGSLRDSWSELLSERTGASPYETFEWHFANLLSFPGERTRILTFVDHNSHLLAVIPLAVRTSRKYLRRKRWLEFAGLPFADYGTCLVRSGFEQAVAKVFVNYLGSQDVLWDGIYLDNVRQNDPFTFCLLNAARQNGLFCSLQQTHQIRRLMKQSNPGAKLQDSKSFLKAKKRMSQLGELQLRVSTGIDQLHAELEQYFRMHIERSASKGFQSQLARPEQQNFYRNIVATCGRLGQVWLSTLFCGEQAVASRFSMRYGEALHLYSTCFAAQFARYSPSMVQLEMLLEYAFENGISVVDFGMGSSPQKEKAGATAEADLARIEIYRSRDALMESQAYFTTQRWAAKSSTIRSAGKLLRQALPVGN